MAVTFPNETDEYRTARNKLLVAEKTLRAQIEEVARQRRALPPGGALKEDYVFQQLVDGDIRDVRLSELFKDGDDTLFIYSFMYSPDLDGACPMCTSFLDGLDGQIRHIEQNISTAVVAKHDIRTIRKHAERRGWRDLRLLSSANNSYNADYHGEADGRQLTTANVFIRDEDGTVRHFWNSELTYEPMMEGGHMRHLDIIWPLWGVLDMTQSGRGDFNPSLRYE